METSTHTKNWPAKGDMQLPFEFCGGKMLKGGACPNWPAKWDMQPPFEFCSGKVPLGRPSVANFNEGCMPHLAGQVGHATPFRILRRQNFKEGCMSHLAGQVGHATPIRPSWARRLAEDLPGQFCRIGRDNFDIAHCLVVTIKK